MRALARRWPLSILALAVTFGACQAVMGLFGSGTAGPVFPHAPHAEEGLDCTDCHDTAEDEAKAGFPASLQACMLCHKEIEAENPDAQKIETFAVVHFFFNL